jgi:hypothetical protein
MKTNLQLGKISDAQKLVPASRATYYTWINDGSVRSLRINGSRYIDLSSLETFVQKASSKTPKKISNEMRRRAYISAEARRKNFGTSDGSKKSSTACAAPGTQTET